MTYQNFYSSDFLEEEGAEMTEETSVVTNYDDDDQMPTRRGYDLLESLHYDVSQSNQSLQKACQDDSSKSENVAMEDPLPEKELEDKYAEEERMWADFEQSNENKNLDYIDRLGMDDDLSPFTLKMPERMPEVVELSNSILPEKYKAPNVLALLPTLGMLATGERHHPLDGGDKLDSLSFYTCVCGPFAIGKSFMGRTQQPILEETIKEDNQKYDHENENRRRAVKNLSTDDFVCDARIMSTTVSRKAILKQMYNNKGKHVLISGAEIDTLADSKYSEWANIRDILKVGFDNGIAGSQHDSTTSVYANFPVFLNMVVSGTYDHVLNFCRTRNNYYDDAIISRICFAPIVEERFMARPQFKSYDGYDKDILKIIAKRLTTINGIYDCDFVSDALNRWEARRLEWAKAHGDYAVDAMLHRVPEIGHRAGQLFACCEDIHDKKIEDMRTESDKQKLIEKQKIVAEAAVYVAELTLRGQYYLFGSHLQRQLAPRSSAAANDLLKEKRHKACYDNVRAILPVRFTREQFIAAYKQVFPGWDGEYKDIRFIPSRWCNSDYNLCKKVGKDEWEKIVQEEIEASQGDLSKMVLAN